jgi:hypothetical protein
VGGSFSALTNVLFSAATDEVDFGWLWTGPVATFNLWVNDFSLGWVLHTALAAGASTYRFHSAQNLISPGAPTGTIAFYLEAVVGETVVSTSTQKSAPYAT